MIDGGTVVDIDHFFRFHVTKKGDFFLHAVIDGLFGPLLKMIDLKNWQRNLEGTKYRGKHVKFDLKNGYISVKPLQNKSKLARNK